MSSSAHEDLSPGQFRPSPMFVTLAFAVIAVAAGVLALRPLLAGAGPVRAKSAALTGGAKVVDAEAVPRNNLLGSLYVIGGPKPAAPKFTPLKPDAAAVAGIDEAPAAPAPTAQPAAAETQAAVEAAPPAAPPSPPAAETKPVSDLPPF